jgi:hypothetical protein
MDGNTDRLREAGLIADKPLPDEYYAFLEGLSEDEVELLLSLKRRLDEAGIPAQPVTAMAGMPVL